MSTLQKALRSAPDGLPTVSTYTLWQVLHGAGYSHQLTRTWCPTGTALRRRKAGAPQLDRRAVSSESLDAWVWAERISVIGLFVLAVGYTLFVVHELFVPVVTAWVMGAILRPIVESAERHGVPRVVAVIATATVALLVLLAIVGLLSTPLAYWI